MLLLSMCSHAPTAYFLIHLFTYFDRVTWNSSTRIFPEQVPGSKNNRRSRH